MQQNKVALSDSQRYDSLLDLELSAPKRAAHRLRVELSTYTHAVRVLGNVTVWALGSLFNAATHLVIVSSVAVS